jgi:hypothetical protein
MAFLPDKTFLEETICNNYNLSNGVSAFTSSDVSKYITLSIQVCYTNIQGNNEFVLEQSNDSTNWADLSQNYTLPVGSGNFIIDKGTFSGKHIRLNLKVASRGLITIKLLAKR